MNSTNQEEATEKKPYRAPILKIHGDVEAITLGDDIGDGLDAAFMTSAGTQGNSRRRRGRIRYS